MCSGERRIESTLNYTNNENIKYFNKNENSIEKKSKENILNFNKFMYKTHLKL